MARLPHITTPMAATQVARAFHRPGWVYEEKVDGWRVLAFKDAAGVRLASRNGRELTRRFPELAAAVAALAPPTLLLDGEIAVFDRQLLSRFEWLRSWPKDETATPPTLIAFDCLYARGKDLRARALRVRRNVLEELVDGQLLIFPPAGSLLTASMPGLRFLSAATKAWSGRMTPQPTSRGGRSPGSRSRCRTYREGQRGWEAKR